MRTIITEAEAANYLGISLRSLQTRRKRGRGPESIKNGRSYFYDQEHLDQWVNARTAKAAEWKFVTQNILIPRFFGVEVDDAHLGAWELEVAGRLAIEVLADGQVLIGFESEDGRSSLTFESVGFRAEGAELWSTGDVTISRIGGQ